MLDHMDSERSSYREALIEHLVLGEILRALWIAGRTAEVMKPQPDHGGYDFVIDCHGAIRHIQLKSSRGGGRAAFQKVHLDLLSKPSGCVVWVVFDPKTLAIRELLWYGAEPGHRLPNITGMKAARHTKANATGHKAVRPRVRQVPRSKFTRLASIEELVERLFGPPT